MLCVLDRVVGFVEDWWECFVFRAFGRVAFFLGKFRNGAHFLCECAWGCIGCEVWGKCC